MPDMPGTPAAPAAPSAPAPSAPAPSAPAPSAPAAAAPPAAAPAPVAPAAPVAPVADAAPAAAAPVVVAAGPAKFDPQTSAVPPKAGDYEQNAEGNMQFMQDNSMWGLAHPEEAAKLRADRAAAEDAGTLNGDVAQPEAAVADAVAAAEGEQPDAAKAPDVAAAPAGAATPAKIEEWTAKSPELKAVFEKFPELHAEMMETARGLEAAKPVLDIVSTPEEAQFAVEHAQRLVSLQTNWMLSGEDPEMVGTAWDQTVDMFKTRDADGKEVLDALGKPVLGEDFKPFVRKAAGTAIEDFTQSAQSTIAALEARLAGNYPTDEARGADAALLENAKYEKAAFDFVLERLKNGADAGASTLPALPPNATPEQVAFQKQLEEQKKELDAKAGKQTAESRQAARTTLDRAVQTHFETGINAGIDAHVAAMKERGEYLPEFVLTDKYINPQTGQPTKVSAFGAKIYLALNAKINSNPLHSAKLASLQALGAGGKEARQAELTRLTNLYMPKIIEAEVTRIQDGIRASNGQARPNPATGVARVEPQSQGTVVPAALSNAEIRTWAEGEAAKDPNWGAMDEKGREVLVMGMAARKKYGA